MSSDFAFSESAELGWKIGHKNRNGEEFVICFRDESCTFFLKNRANKDSFDVVREGKYENCKYFLERKQNKDSYDVGREDKLKIAKKNSEKKQRLFRRW